MASIGWTRKTPDPCAATAGQTVDTETGSRLWADPHQSLELFARDGQLLLAFWGVPTVLVDPAQRRVEVLVTAGAFEPETLEHLLADQVLPRLAAAAGNALVLHAGAVSQAAGSILLLGDSGRGKSTLSAALASAGCSLLSDDAVILTISPEAVAVAPVYPSLRLLPDTIAALYPAGVATAPVADYTTKQRLPVAQAYTARATMLVVLDPPGTAEAVTLRPLRAGDACMALLGNSFSLSPADPADAASRLAGASAVANRVAAFAITYPRDYERLPEVCAALLQAHGDLPQQPAIQSTESTSL